MPCDRCARRSERLLHSGLAFSEDDGKQLAEGADIKVVQPQLSCQRFDDNAFQLISNNASCERQTAASAAIALAK